LHENFTWKLFYNYDNISYVFIWFLRHFHDFTLSHSCFWLRKGHTRYYNGFHMEREKIVLSRYSKNHQRRVLAWVYSYLFLCLAGEVVWYFTSPSTIFQLYRGGQFYWWREPEYPEITTNLSQITDNLYHVMLYQTHLALSVMLYRAHLAMSGIQTHNINGDFISVDNNVVHVKLMTLVRIPIRLCRKTITPLPKINK